MDNIVYRFIDKLKSLEYTFENDLFEIFMDGVCVYSRELRLHDGDKPANKTQMKNYHINQFTREMGWYNYPNINDIVFHYMKQK